MSGRSGGDGADSGDGGNSSDGSDSDAATRRSESPSGRRAERDVPAPTENPILWYLRTPNLVVVASRDVLSSVLLVSLVGLALFAVSGVWPPMVAVESGSMEPHLEKGDLVIVVEGDRFASELADQHGVVTRARATGTEHSRWRRPGSVIVYRPDGRDGTPIIHRAAFSVEDDERWVERGDPRHLGSADSCENDPRDNCPAPHAGYVTRGDAVRSYDQIGGQSTVVKPEWIEGRAVAHVPYLGCIRLAMSDTPGCWAEQ